MLERFFDWVDQSEVRSFIFYWVILVFLGYLVGYVIGFTLGIYLFKFMLWIVVGK
jgi:hypothetical protein